jgi:hypothetical protein
VSAPIDRKLVARLLQDETLSFREVARRANCSDWSARAIWRELESVRRDDPSGVPNEHLTPLDWAMFGGFVALLFGGIAAVAWLMPPAGNAPE